MRRELRVDDHSRRQLALANAAAAHSIARAHEPEIAAHEAAGTLQVGEDLSAIVGDRLHVRAPRSPAAPAIAPAPAAPAAAPARPKAPAVPQRAVVRDLALRGDLEERALEHLAVAEL